MSEEIILKSKSARKKVSIQNILEKELRKLCKKFDLNLKVRWKPDNNSKSSGEVKNNIIYIYEEDKDKAINTLKHEVMDYFITTNTIDDCNEINNTMLLTNIKHIVMNIDLMLDYLCKQGIIKESNREIVSKAINDYIIMHYNNLISGLNSSLNRVLYRKKEKVVEQLLDIISL